MCFSEVGDVVMTLKLVIIFLFVYLVREKRHLLKRKLAFDLTTFRNLILLANKTTLQLPTDLKIFSLKNAHRINAVKRLFVKYEKYVSEYFNRLLRRR